MNDPVLYANRMAAQLASDQSVVVLTFAVALGDQEQAVVRVAVPPRLWSEMRREKGEASPAS